MLEYETFSHRGEDLASALMLCPCCRNWVSFILECRNAEHRKVEEQKTEEQKVEEQKVEERKVEEQKVEEQKVEEQKVEEQKVEEQKVDILGVFLGQLQTEACNYNGSGLNSRMSGIPEV